MTGFAEVIKKSKLHIENGKGMDKKLKWFYRLAILMISVCILSNILVKAVIWLPALKEPQGEYREIIIRKFTMHRKCRFTTEIKQKLFNKVDYLLTPAFTIFFVVIAVKLVKTAEIFTEKE